MSHKHTLRRHQRRQLSDGSIKCQQIAGGDGYATMGDGNTIYLFGFGPFSGLNDIYHGLPGTQPNATFNTLLDPASKAAPRVARGNAGRQFQIQRSHRAGPDLTQGATYTSAPATVAPSARPREWLNVYQVVQAGTRCTYPDL